ncbi:MAG: type II toxin-antitoxin system RelE/ParE family toxin [archaeon]|nr:type II toxin-antitoxin system RelE/ParE family toxin [archaeon]
MAYSFYHSDCFKKEFKKLDKHQQELVKKKMEKIIAQPELGKPLHAPLQNFKSERIEKLRIIYTIEGTTIKFAWIDDRGHAYD